jgi:Ca2+-binding RTX toxin-like protein
VNGTDSLVIRDWFNDVSKQIETIRFATGGTVLTHAQLTSPFLTLMGTDAAETIQGGNAYEETLSGLGGNDVLYGGGGNDHLYGGAGDDQLYGGEGADTYYFNQGDGQDTISDTSSGNTLVFGPGLLGLLTVSGGFGQDVVYSFGATADSVRVKAGSQLSITFVSEGSAAADVLNGSSHGDIIYGLGGDDVINGNEGADTLHGGAGNDTLVGGAGSDRLYGGDGDDILDGYQLTGASDDQTYGSDSRDYYFGGKGNDTLYGNSGGDSYFSTSAMVTTRSSKAVSSGMASGFTVPMTNWFSDPVYHWKAWRLPRSAAICCFGYPKRTASRSGTGLPIRNPGWKPSGSMTAGWSAPRT